MDHTDFSGGGFGCHDHCHDSPGFIPIIVPVVGVGVGTSVGGRAGKMIAFLVIGVFLLFGFLLCTGRVQLAGNYHHHHYQHQQNQQ